MHRPKGSANPIEGFITVSLALHALRRWWKLALPAALLLASMGVMAIHTAFVPQYEAVAWLRIDEQPTHLAFESRYEDRQQAFASTQVELLRSPLVLGAVVREPDIAQYPEIKSQKDAERWLAKELSVSAVGKSELHRISIKASQPEHAARIVNAVLDAYFKLIEQDETGRTGRVITLLEEERERRGMEVAALRTEVQDLRKRAGDEPLLPRTDAAARQPLQDLQLRLITAEVDREMLKAKIRAAEQGESLPASGLDVESADRLLNEAPEVRALQAAVAEKQARLQAAESRSVQGKNDPLCRILAEELLRDEGKLARLQAELQRKTQSERATASQKKAAEELAALRAELESRQSAEEVLRARYEDQLKKLQQPTGERLELAAKMAQLERAEKVYEQIADRVTKFKTEQRAPGRVSLLQRAETPVAPVELFAFKRMAIAVLAGLGLPFILAVAWERLIRRVSDSQSLEEQVSGSLVMEVPLAPRVRDARGRAASNRDRTQRQMFEEGVDRLTTTLLLSAAAAEHRLLAVTSAAPSEGKTTLAAQLAISIAHATGKPTLVIDGDMRSPDLHRQFDLPMEPGLADVLAGKCGPDDAILRTGYSNVDLIPAGLLMGSALGLLRGNAMEALLQKLGERYDRIVLDTPPLLAASESIVLAKAAGACLLSTMRDVSRKDQVQKAQSRLDAAGIRIIGTVLNGAAAKNYSYSYGSKARQHVAC